MSRGDKYQRLYLHRAAQEWPRLGYRALRNAAQSLISASAALQRGTAPTRLPQPHSTSLHLRLAMILSVGAGALVAWSLYPNSAGAPRPPVASAVSVPAGSRSRESVEDMAPHRPAPAPDGFDVVPPTGATERPRAPRALDVIPLAQTQLRFDPLRLRRIMDLGVETYGSAGNEQQRAKGAKLLQLSALLGFAPARRLVVYNYPLAAAMREVVPESDSVRYALALLAIDGANAEASGASPLNARTLLISLGRFFSARREISHFATAVTQELRTDSHYRALRDLEALLGALSEVPDACTEIASVLARTAAPDACGPVLTRDLLAFTQTQAPLDANADAHRRALVLTAELGKLP